MSDGILDEALLRLRDTGPEPHGRLSHHAPMAAEALAPAGCGDALAIKVAGTAVETHHRTRDPARLAPAHHAVGLMD